MSVEKLRGLLISWGSFRTFRVWHGVRNWVLKSSLGLREP